MSNQQNSNQKAVILLSGGLDSSTALAWAIREKKWLCHTVAFDYGQRHRIELKAAKEIAQELGVEHHHVISVDLAAIGGSALTEDIDVPKDEHNNHNIPVTYVPARNLIFLSLAAALAETINASNIVIGANIVDYSGYPDCRPDFLSAFAKVAQLGTKTGDEGNPLNIIAPLIELNKSEIILLGLKLGLDYGLTRSCYDPLPNGMPCGHCDSCHFRQEGFAQLNKVDPLSYS
ncbi:MAG: 7-cyano-7-deazaguanine synthase QueC [Mariprofundaceae bacterium]